MERKYKQVTKEEFDRFVSEYPSPLDWNVARVCEPRLGSHNDFSSGKVWPESMVTKVKLYDDSDRRGGKQSEYYILKS